MAVDNCNQVLEKVYDYLHGELAPEEKASINRHLKDCLNCSREYLLEKKITGKIISSSWNQSSTESLVQRAIRQLQDEDEL